MWKYETSFLSGIVFWKIRVIFFKIGGKIWRRKGYVRWYPGAIIGRGSPGTRQWGLVSTDKLSWAYSSPVRRGGRFLKKRKRRLFVFVFCPKYQFHTSASSCSWFHGKEILLALGSRRNSIGQICLTHNKSWAWKMTVLSAFLLSSLLLIAYLKCIDLKGDVISFKLPAQTRSSY